RRDIDQNLRAARRDEESHDCCETRCAVILARKTYRDTDRKQQAEVVKDRLPRCGHRGHIEQIALAEPQQQCGNRQDGYRQHQRTTDALQACERTFHTELPTFTSLPRPTRPRTSSAVFASSARAAMLSQASIRSARRV